MIRLIFLYPLLAVAGAAWTFLFWVRFKQVGCRGDMMAAWLGVAVSALGVSGVLALWIGSLRGFSGVTSAMLTGGLLAVAIVLLVGIFKAATGK